MSWVLAINLCKTQHFSSSVLNIRSEVSNLLKEHLFQTFPGQAVTKDILPLFWSVECLLLCWRRQEMHEPFPFAVRCQYQQKLYNSWWLYICLCSHFWDAEGGLEERNDSEVPLETQESPQKVEKKISETFFYSYEDIHSQPFVTEDSGIPVNLLTLKYPFCWGCAYLKLIIFNRGSQSSTSLIWSSLRAEWDNSVRPTLHSQLYVGTTLCGSLIGGRTTCKFVSAVPWGVFFFFLFQGVMAVVFVKDVPLLPSIHLSPRKLWIWEASSSCCSGISSLPAQHAEQ